MNLLKKRFQKFLLKNYNIRFYLSVKYKNLKEKCLFYQCAKKVMSDSPGLVDFAIGLVDFVLNLPDGQVLFFEKIQITEGL